MNIAFVFNQTKLLYVVGSLEIIQSLVVLNNIVQADVNAVNRYGLTGLHILLAQLLDLAFLQTKPKESRPGKVS